MPSKKSLTPRSIQEDTGIIPEAVVESVVEEANRLLRINIEEDLRSDIYGFLTGYAEAVYSNNASFRKKIRSNTAGGNAGRDSLYVYIRHWLSSELIKSCSSEDRLHFRKILESTRFSMGHEIR